MLQIVKQLLITLLLAAAALPGLQTVAQAEQLNNSVKDCFEQKAGDCAEPAKGAGSAAKEEGSGGVGINSWDIAKMIFATAFVIGLLYFLLKFINKKSRTYKSSQLVENLGGASLGASKSIQIIKVGRQLLVVGVGDNIQLLKEIDDEEEYHQIINDYNNKMEQLVQPSDIVTKVIQRAKAARTANAAKSKSAEGSNGDFQSVLKGQLEELSRERRKIHQEMEQKGPKDQ
ncbi:MULTISPECIES: flagellar biosynthetic protein FliO [Bacillus]|uniref:flagellar biosynthetic protein FliO n=1 Tax=Bacillus TaxID=1386 RepID=UPI00209F7630|nr:MULTISPECIES: flagellar biosynthetic protein FliO [Bacillus]MCP1158067.1 flagellar biosynthetic protein FliO [Bacillus infantis]MDT0159377.1 flagellar biosynthetic protein FliO [Bacillus sp. AG4(2022)]